MCVQLDLFSGAYAPANVPNGASRVSDPIEVMTEDDFNSACHRQDLDCVLDFMNPCRFCELRGICDEDECGAHCFELDGEECTMSWSDWLDSDKY